MPRLLAALLLLSGPAALPAAAAPPTSTRATGTSSPASPQAFSPAAPPELLGAAWARQVLAKARAAGVRRVQVTLDPAPELARAPAALAIAAAIERTLHDEGGLEPMPDGWRIVARFERHGGRLHLGATLPREGSADYALASAAETDAWWGWLHAPMAPATDASGFAFGPVGALDLDVVDADAGDLDGDGRVEVVVATADAVVVFAIDREGPRRLAEAALPPPDPRAGHVASRAERTFVRIIPGAGAPGEVRVHRTAEGRTRVFGWEPGTRTLGRRADRRELVLATVFRRGGVDVVEATPEAGTNRFREPPSLRAGRRATRARIDAPWLDLRGANLATLDALAAQGPSFALLGEDGRLRMLDRALAETDSLAGCGAAFALADFDGDGRAEPLCAGDGPIATRDRLVLGPAGAPRFRAEVDGTVVALAAGLSSDGTPVALVFVRSAALPGVEVWSLRGPSTAPPARTVGRTP